MTAAYRLKGLGWFGGCVVVVLGFYLVSLQVAAERKKLDQVNTRIAAAERDLRALETEFDTRANMVQLERWNGDTLALSAPTAGQFVADEAQLASLDANAANGTEMAALVVPSVAVSPVVPVIPSAPVAAPVPQPAMSRAAVQMAAVDRVPVVVKASATRVVEPAHPQPAAKREAAARATAAVAKVRPEAVAMLDRKLLSDSTLGDLLSGAHHEAGRRR
jgi:hypothetical protein